MTKKIQKGFTLIEILVVIGIIAILAAVVLIAINPARQFAQARDSQRNSNLNAILNAVGQRIADNKGLFNCTPDIPTTEKVIKNPVGTDGVDLRSCIVPTYLPELPVDPSIGKSYNSLTGEYDTGYTIFKDTNGRIHLKATATEPNIPRNDPIEIVR